MFEKSENTRYLMFSVCFELNVDVLSVSMSFNVVFCIYEHI